MNSYIGARRIKKVSSSLCFYFVLIVFCFWPTYFLGGVNVSQKIYYFVVAGFSLLLSLVSVSRFKLDSFLSIFIGYLFLFFFVFIQDLEYASFFHVGVIVKHFLLFIFCVCFYSILVSAFSSYEDLVRVSRAFFYLLIAQICYVILQVIYPESDFLSIWNHKEVVTDFGLRPPGFFDWVYATCFFYVYFIVCCILNYSFKVSAVKNLLLLGFLLVLVLVSQSKAGYVTVFLSILYTAFISKFFLLKNVCRIVSLMCLGVALLIFIIVGVGIDLTYISNFVQMFLDGKLDGSTGTRQYQAELAISQGISYWNSGSPLAKDGIIIENAYLDYLFRYGILGGIFFILFMLSAWWYSFMVMRSVIMDFREGRVGVRPLAVVISCHVTVFASIIINNSGSITDGYKSSFWFYIILSVLFFAKKLVSNGQKDTITGYK
ncbi:hypothetical protein [Shewanella algae]|uniref:hypothetical protein n=1 Tax=Shewanella algae TaxID=38313 RepID=UPI003005C425